MTEVTLTQKSQTLVLKHITGFFSGKTSFEIDGKKLHWKGQSALIEEGTGVCLAVYRPKSFETKARKLGTLLITAYGLLYVDAIVTSALVEQERTDEAEHEVISINDFLTCIEIGVF
jgi:hypothetical protein